MRSWLVSEIEIGSQEGEAQAHVISVVPRPADSSPEIGRLARFPVPFRDSRSRFRGHRASPRDGPRSHRLHEGLIVLLARQVELARLEQAIEGVHPLGL